MNLSATTANIHFKSRSSQVLYSSYFIYLNLEIFLFFVGEDILWLLIESSVSPKI